MKFSILLNLIFSTLHAFSYDCGPVAPFDSKGQLSIRVSVSKLKWDQSFLVNEDVCVESVKLNWFDVRNREEEAYYCLKPEPQEVLTCKTTLADGDAEVAIVPASWIRAWSPNPVREYRFHAYVVKKSDPQFYYDIFSRSLLPDLSSQDVIVEGSLRTGPSNPDDGFWIRVEFLK